MTTLAQQRSSIIYKGFEIETLAEDGGLVLAWIYTRTGNHCLTIRGSDLEAVKAEALTAVTCHHNGLAWSNLGTPSPFGLLERTLC